MKRTEKCGWEHRTEYQMTKYIVRSGQEIVMYTKIHIGCKVLMSGKLW